MHSVAHVRFEMFQRKHVYCSLQVEAFTRIPFEHEMGPRGNQTETADQQRYMGSSNLWKHPS